MTRKEKLQRNYAKATVTVQGKPVMKDGKLLDTPFAKEWWERKLKRK